MPTVAEEQQVKEFLRRAEVRTMKKDLQALRETDALKERDKIAQIKTLEEQLSETKAKQAAEKAQAESQKEARNEVLLKNENEEKIAEKDLKNYGTEQERQQIFLMESERLEAEKQIDSIDKEKDPALKMEKNKLLLQARDWQKKLNDILEEEKKLEDQQKFLAEKAQASTVPSERKGLEQSRWDMDKKIQDTEKKRWEAEKSIEGINGKVAEIDKSSDKLVNEKNELRNKVLGINKSLREIYSAIIAREEDTRKGKLAEQQKQKEILEKSKEERNEKIQRQQWSGKSIEIPVPPKKKNFQAEEEQRKKFLQDVEKQSNIK